MESPNEIHKELHDERLNGQSYGTRDEREVAAFEYMVKEGVKTAKRMGREVSEDQVREEMARMLEPVERKAADGGYENDNRQRSRGPAEEYVEVEDK